MTPGIYTIIHLASGRQYIGSSKNIEARWVSHKHDLSRGIHPCQYLQHAWNKHGSDAFDFVIVQSIPDYYGRMLQEDYFLKNVELLYNTRRTAFVIPPSAEELVSKSLSGRKRNPEAVAKTAAAHRGMKRSPQAKDNMSKSHKGRVMPEEEKAKHRGPKSEEFKQACSKARKGKPLSEQHKQALTGRKWEDEPRDALSKKQKDNWARRKEEGFKWSDDVVQKRNEAIRKAKQANPWKPTPEFGKKVSEGQKRRQERERQLRNNTGCPPMMG